MRQEMGPRPPFGREPLAVRILVSCRNGPDHHRDLDNILKALLDAANGIVYEDDRWVDVVSISREVGEEDRTLMIVERIEEERIGRPNRHPDHIVR
jgi:Holliday junction resolvase RusA-like endonuclease